MGKYVDEAGLTRVVNKTKDMVAASKTVATSSTPGIVKPDGKTLSVQSDGTIGLHSDINKKLIPVGGNARQLLVKKSDTDYDTEWTNSLDTISTLNIAVQESATFGQPKNDKAKAHEPTSDTFIFNADVTFNERVRFNGDFERLGLITGSEILNETITTDKLADSAVTKAKLSSDISIPDIEYSQTDLEAGVSELAAGKLYFVYE